MATEFNLQRGGMVRARGRNSVRVTDVYHVTAVGDGDVDAAFTEFIDQFPLGGLYPTEPYQSDGATCDGHRKLETYTGNIYRFAVDYVLRRRFTVFPRLRRWSTTSASVPGFKIPVVVERALYESGDPLMDYAYVPFEREIRYRYETHIVGLDDQEAVDSAVQDFRGRLFTFAAPGEDTDNQDLWYRFDGADTRTDNNGQLLVRYRFSQKDRVPEFPEETLASQLFATPALGMFDEYVEVGSGDIISVDVVTANTLYGDEVLLLTDATLPGSWPG